MLSLVRPRPAGARPNVVVILADDQGWGDLSIHGNTNLSTPHIDSLAHDGELFERFYVCAVCAPTRAEYLTGRYHSRGGVRGVSTGAERLNLDEMTIAQTFKRPATPQALSASSITGRSFPIIRTPAASTNTTVSLPDTGDSISTPNSITTASWYAARATSPTI